MSKTKTCIVFKNIHQLWKFAQTLNASSIEIITSEKILICECSEADLALLAQHGGEIKESEFSRSNAAN